MTTTSPPAERAVSDRLLGRAQRDRRGGDGPAARAHAGLGPAVRARGPDPARSASSRRSRRATPTRSTSPTGRGSHVWDQDGSEYLDFHGGFGAMVVGHAHPRIVEAIARGGGPRHPLRGDHRGGGRLRRGDLPAVRSRDAPLRQLGHRGDDGRHPGGAGRHRARRGLQDRGLVPRPPRRGDVLGGPQRRHDGRPRAARPRRRCRRGWSRTRTSYIEVVPFNDADALERLLRRAGPRDRLPDHGAGDDEHRHRRAAARLPPAGARAVHQARRRLHLRRDQDRLHDRRRAAPPSASACSPTSSASPRRSRAGCPAAAFGGREDLMRLIERGVSQMGTYNGNPLVSHVGLVTAARGADARRLRAPGASSAPGSPRGCQARDRPPRAAGAHGRPRRQGLRLLPPDADDATTATSSRPSRSCSRPRTPGCSTAASS